MLTPRLTIIVLILCTLLIAVEFTQAAPAPGHKKSRQHVKSKKSNNGNKLKTNFKKAAVNNPQHRNGKMNLYSPRSWPSSNNYYHTAASPFYLRSSPSTSMYYPTRWSSTPNYFQSPYLRRSDDYLSSMTAAPTMAPSSMMSLGGSSQTPTIIDMSAFTGSNGLLDNAFSGQNIWSLPEVAAPAGKSKFNLFNSFSLNDDGLFGGLFNQFK